MFDPARPTQTRRTESAIADNHAQRVVSLTKLVRDIIADIKNAFGVIIAPDEVPRLDADVAQVERIGRGVVVKITGLPIAHFALKRFPCLRRSQIDDGMVVKLDIDGSHQACGGETVTIEIEKIGSLSNPVVAESIASNQALSNPRSESVNPFLGVMYHWIGGLAAASFYLPYLSVKKWAWETYWLVGGFFAWIIAPWVLSLILVPDTIQLLRNAPLASLGWAIFYGAAWGIGGITYGLTMRYLGIALGAAVALGACAAFGTLMPPIFDGTFGQIIQKHSGQIILAGVLTCMAGISISGLAGMSKERELTTEQKRQSSRDFQFIRGILTALLCGFTSAAMAYGFAAGKPIAAMTKSSLLDNGRNPCWQNLPLLIVILIGGFATNFAWCLYQNLKNKTVGDYLKTTMFEDFESAGMTLSSHGGPAASSTSQAVLDVPPRATATVPIVSNYILCAVAGVTWYLQFFFYGIGTTKMGKYDFSSWTLHMASIIIFATLWGIVLKEWKGTSRRTHALIAAGLTVLIASTVIVGYGNYLAAQAN